MNKIILASASPRRQELLTQIGMEFKVIPSGMEEVPQSRQPEVVVMELSEGKAGDVFESLPEKEKENSLVIGADTIVAFKGRIMGKPDSRENAQEILSCLQGGIHQVYTGVTLIWQGGKRSFYEKTDVVMYPMSMEEIKEYVDTGEPMDKAGAYGVQGRGALLVERLEGDFFNVMGLPVLRLARLLERFGVHLL